TPKQFIWPATATPLTEALRGGILIVKPAAVARTRYARRFIDSLQIAGWMSRLYILILLLRPFISRDRLEAPKEEVERVFQLHGQHSVAAFAIQSDKHHLLVLNGQGLVAFAARGSIALACGDPLAPDEMFTQAVEEYTQHCG